jgi:signal transduction histidine kinase
VFVPREITAQVAKVSAAPIYAPYDTFMTAGAVGGYMDTFEGTGKATGELALDILSGTAGSRFKTPPSEFRVDFKHLQRWNLSEKLLPPGTVVLSKPPPIWEQHRDTVIATIAVVALQSLFITALLIEMRRRRRAEGSLLESEQRVAVTEGRLRTAEQEYKDILSELGERLLALQEEERRRIASELHDSTGQHLVAADLSLMQVVAQTKQTPRLKTLFDQIQTSIDAAQKELRIFTYLLYPADLEKEGLKTVIERFVEGFGRRAGLETSLQVGDGLETLPYSIQRSSLRIVQEALSNVRRHAHATNVTVKLVKDRGFLTIHIRDDGHGIQGDAEASGRVQFGVGIPGMQARVRGFGGDLRIVSGVRGTSVIAAIPLLEDGQDASALADMIETAPEVVPLVTIQPVAGIPAGATEMRASNA